jgi:hypothetical protein
MILNPLSIGYISGQAKGFDGEPVELPNGERGNK